MCLYDTTNSYFAGPVTDLYLSGKPEMKGEYRLLKKEGEFTFYYDNGVIESTGMYENNKRTGAWKYFWRNGKPKTEADFSPALGDEPMIHYLTDSTGISLMKNGTGKWIETTQYDDGITGTVTGEYKDYHRHGKWTFTTSMSKNRREEYFNEGNFLRGAIYEPGRTTKVTEPIEYSIHSADKFFKTEKFYSTKGVDFILYPALKMINIESTNPIYNYRVSPHESDEIFRVFDTQAVPSGGTYGLNGLTVFVLTQIQYPEGAVKAYVKGTAVVKFIVEKDGSLSNIETSMNPVGYGIDEEVIRVVNEYAKSNKWTPATLGGEAVRSSTIHMFNVDATRQAETFRTERPPISEDDLGLNDEGDEIFVIVEESTAPAEGLTKMYETVNKNMTFPDEARKKNISGRVFCEFVVERDGSITNIKVVKGVGAGCNEAVLDALTQYAKSTKWNPGRQSGQAIRQRMVLPFRCGR